MYTLCPHESTMKETTDYSKSKTYLTRHQHNFFSVTAICIVFDFRPKGELKKKKKVGVGGGITSHLNSYEITVKVANFHNGENGTAMLQLS